LDPNEKWKKDNGFVAGKVGKYLLFVNCPQGEMGLEGGVNKGRKLHTFLKRGCLETATEYCNFKAHFHLSSIEARVDSSAFSMGNPMPKSTLLLCQS
jgi:hypothetical protein